MFAAVLLAHSESSEVEYGVAHKLTWAVISRQPTSPYLCVGTREIRDTQDVSYLVHLGSEVSETVCVHCVVFLSQSERIHRRMVLH